MREIKIVVAQDSLVSVRQETQTLGTIDARKVMLAGLLVADLPKGISTITSKHLHI